MNKNEKGNINQKPNVSTVMNDALKIYKDAICPIYFVGNNNEFQNKSLCAANLPLAYTASINNYISNNQDKLLDPIYSTDIISNFDFRAIKIYEYNVIGYIISITMSNIASAFLSCREAEYFKMIPILQNIQDDLYKYENMHDIKYMISQIFNHHSDCSMDTRKYNNMKYMNQLITSCDHISHFISQHLCTIISFAADKAITDTVLQVHVVPNIKDLYNKVINDELFISGVNCTAKEVTPMHIAAFLNTRAGQIINMVIKNYIEVEVNKLLKASPFSLFFIYDDYKTFSMKDPDAKPLDRYNSAEYPHQDDVVF